MRILTSLWLLVVVVSLDAYAQTPLIKETPQIRMPLGIGYGIADVLCEDVKNALIPKKLEELEIPFEWVEEEEEEELLVVGPIIEEAESDSAYFKIRQTYFLIIVCRDEVSTSITSEAALEGLNVDDDWISITDFFTIKQYFMQFLQRLDL